MFVFYGHFLRFLESLIDKERKMEDNVPDSLREYRERKVQNHSRDDRIKK